MEESPVGVKEIMELQAETDHIIAGLRTEAYNLEIKGGVPNWSSEVGKAIATLEAEVERLKEVNLATTRDQIRAAIGLLHNDKGDYNKGMAILCKLIGAEVPELILAQVDVRDVIKAYDEGKTANTLLSGYFITTKRRPH